MRWVPNTGVSSQAQARTNSVAPMALPFECQAMPGQHLASKSCRSAAEEAGWRVVPSPPSLALRVFLRRTQECTGALNGRPSDRATSLPCERLTRLQATLQTSAEILTPHMHSSMHVPVQSEPLEEEVRASALTWVGGSECGVLGVLAAEFVEFASCFAETPRLPGEE